MSRENATWGAPRIADELSLLGFGVCVATGQQIANAFPFDEAPKYLLLDNDGICGEEFARRVKGINIDDVHTAFRSPWQNPYAERVIGSIRRECLDHMIILGEDHLRRVLAEYFGCDARQFNSKGRFKFLFRILLFHSG